MGQEIESARFTPADFERFGRALAEESALLARWFDEGRLSRRGPVAGFEIEAWLVGDTLAPAPVNDAFLERFADPLASAELARFNIELNNRPRALEGAALSRLERELADTWQRACATAQAIGAELLMIGILPTVTAADLGLHNMSPLNRYRALNEQVLRAREGHPLRLDIVGRETLHGEHGSVMLESATTSFQIHLQAPFERAHHLYNAAIMASAPMVAASANSPYLFGHDLWDETRIPLFERSVEIGGYAGAAHGPLRRVSFGSGYARRSVLECFEENLQHFPVLLPMRFRTTGHLEHLRLHNGTIWRWNRPLVGFDEDGTPHLRIEHRVVPAGPTIVDSIANAAMFYGLAEAFARALEHGEPALPFSQAKDNFYQAARHGLQATVLWHGDERIGLRSLLLERLLPLAQGGLESLGLDGAEIAHYLGIVRARIETGQTGCAWQRRWVDAHGRDLRRMTAVYRDRQRSGAPVHTWGL